jgi:hypothetical protein
MHVDQAEKTGQAEIRPDVHDKPEVQRVQQADMGKFLHLAIQLKRLGDYWNLAAFAAFEAWISLANPAGHCEIFDLLELVVSDNISLVHLCSYNSIQNFEV